MQTGKILALTSWVYKDEDLQMICKYKRLYIGKSLELRTFTEWEYMRGKLLAMFILFLLFLTLTATAEDRSLDYESPHCEATLPSLIPVHHRCTPLWCQWRKCPNSGRSLLPKDAKESLGWVINSHLPRYYLIPKKLNHPSNLLSQDTNDSTSPAVCTYNYLVTMSKATAGDYPYGNMGHTCSRGFCREYSWDWSAAAWKKRISLQNKETLPGAWEEHPVLAFCVF